MSKPKIYLAGPIAGLDYAGAVAWRELFTEAFGDDIECFSPMRAKECLKGVGAFDPKADDRPGHVLGSAASVFTRDRFDVARCDLILANLRGAKTVSIGTMFEIAWAYELRKPIVLVMEPGNVHEHAFVEQATPFRTRSLHEAGKMVRQILLP